MIKTLQFGIIGLGHFGKHYARLLQEIPGVNLVAVANKSCEVFEENEISLRDGITKSLDESEILNNNKIDCVVIATPPSTHKDLIVKSIRAGKHVLVEKPMVIGAAEAKAVEKELKKRRDLVFMVGFQYIYNDYIRYLKEHIADLGKVGYVVAENFYFGPLRKDVGCFADAGVHELSILEYLLNPGDIKKVSRSSFGVQNNKIDDFTAAAISFKNGVKAYIAISWFMPEKSRKMTIVGDKGVAIFNDSSDEKLRIYKRVYRNNFGDQPSDFMKDLSNIPQEVPKLTVNEPLRSELEHFIHCVNTGSESMTGFKFGNEVVKKSCRIMA